MGVWLRHRPIVMMLVVLIVDVGMLVLHRLMEVRVLVALCEVQPQTHTHQRAGHDELHRHRLA